MSATSTPDTNPDTNLELAQKARALLPILRRQARRPYIVELAGTPKSGKTTALHVLRGFLKECGYQVHEMRERAGDCPIAMKGHFFFNTWTTTTMLASMIEHLESEADVLLLDRGVFDALVWLEAQSQQHQVTEEERNVFREFVLLDRWRQLTDLTLVLKVAPKIALERENKDLLIPRTGSIMSEEYLDNYNRVLEQVQESVRNKFQFFDVDTTEYRSPQATTHAIAAKLVEHMETWADPVIATLPRSIVEQMFRYDAIRSLPDVIAEVERNLVFHRRSTLSQSDAFVGLVGAAVLRHGDKMLLLRRSEEHDEKRALYGRDVLWKGCHIASADTSTSDLLGTAAVALKARLKEDFHLARLESEPRPRFLVWARDDRKARHIGVFFDLEIPTDDVAQSLAGKVFKRERDHTKLGGKQFISPADLQALVKQADIELEPWSQTILDHMAAKT